MRQAPTVVLSPGERDELEEWVRSSTPSDRRAMRARVILEAAGGRTNGEIARTLGVHSETVTRWRHRFVLNRLEGIRRDAPRSGARTRVPPSVTERIVRTTLEESPPEGGRWTTRSLARALQVNHMLVHRVWRARGLGPGYSVPPPVPVPGSPWVDLVGLYVDDPARVIVFGQGNRPSTSDEPPVHPRIDPELSGAFLLSVPPGVPVLLVSLLGRSEEPRPRVADAHRSSSELLVFLRSLEEQVPPGVELHAIFDRPLDFLSPRVGAWLKAHPRYRVRTTPAGGSWTSAVDEWLNGLRALALHPASFHGVAALAGGHDASGAGPFGSRRRFSWISTSGLPTPLVPARPARPTRIGLGSDDAVRPRSVT